MARGRLGMVLTTIVLVTAGVTVACDLHHRRYPACKRDRHCKADEGEPCVDGTCQQCTEDADCERFPELEHPMCHDYRCNSYEAIKGELVAGSTEPSSPAAGAGG